jgi:23S rRNA (pseudouridine1915-N3)-methyltransferase
MKLELWAIGKTNEDYLKTGIETYQKRLKHYINFSIDIIPNIKQRKNLTFQQIKFKEGELILNKTQKSDFLILLDDKGKTFTSEQFAKHIDKLMAQGHRRVIFLIGGAYGFSEAVYKRSNARLSLSAMTFSHQMVRLFFVEQLYRAFTILKNEPYHHS